MGFMDSLSDLVNRIPDSARGNPVFWGASFLAVVLPVAAYFFLIKTEYSTLYSGLSDIEAADIVQVLEESKTEYTISSDGGEILVRDQDVAKARMDIASSDVLVKSGLGFELFDEADYGMSDFTQKINLQRALQGELSRTITSLEAIKFARVHLTLPESSIFEANKNQAKASVALVFEPGASISDDKVNGIRNLVASAVEGLTSSSVVVLNGNGIVLSGGDSQTVGLQSRLKLKSQTEAYFKKKVESALRSASLSFSPVVDIDISLDHNEVKRTTESFGNGESDVGIIVKSKVSRSTVGSRNQKSKEKGRASGDLKEVKEQEYKVDREIEEHHIKAGSIDRITVGLLVPGDVPESDVEAIKLMVGSIVGLNTERGDEIVAKRISTWLSKKAEARLDVQSGHTSLTAPSDGRTVHLESEENSSGSSIRAKSSAFFQNNWGYIVVAVAILTALVTWIAVLSLRSRNIRRQQLLEDMRAWLEVDSQPNSLEAKHD